MFKASLTELEAAGIRAVSAQSLAIGQSADLPQDELARVTAAGVSVVGLDDPNYPADLKQISDPPLVLYVRGNVEAIAQPGVAVVGLAILPPAAWEWRSVCRVTSRPADYSSAARRSPFSVQEWTSSIRRRTHPSPNRF